MQRIAIADQDRLQSRRLQQVRLDPVYIRCFLEGIVPPLRYDLPDDTTVLTVYPDPTGLFLYALVHSETFPVVPTNEVPPSWQGTISTGRLENA
jgi:hypothetical protein